MHVVEAVNDALDVANAITVAVGEAARINLIKDGLLPPCQFWH